MLQVGIRRRALGWPLTVSQEEHLSYCVGSPLYARRLRDFIESDLFNLICFFIQLPASGGIASWIRRVQDSWSLRVALFPCSIFLLGNIRCLALGWPLAVSQEEHLSYYVGSP